MIDSILASKSPPPQHWTFKLSYAYFGPTQIILANLQIVLSEK